MRHKVRDLGVFFCFALMLFTVTSCGKEVSDQTIAATEQSSEERRDAEADIVAAQEKLSANSVAVRMESRVLFVMARV